MKIAKKNSFFFNFMPLRMDSKNCNCKAKYKTKNKLAAQRRKQKLRNKQLN